MAAAAQSIAGTDPGGNPDSMDEDLEDLDTYTDEGLLIVNARIEQIGWDNAPARRAVVNSANNHYTHGAGIARALGHMYRNEVTTHAAMVDSPALNHQTTWHAVNLAGPIPGLEIILHHAWAPSNRQSSSSSAVTRIEYDCPL